MYYALFKAPAAQRRVKEDQNFILSSRINLQIGIGQMTVLNVLQK